MNVRQRHCMSLVEAEFQLHEAVAIVILSCITSGMTFIMFKFEQKSQATKVTTVNLNSEKNCYVLCM